MPALHQLKSPEELQSLSLHAHLERTRARIADFRRRLEVLNTPEAATAVRTVTGEHKQVSYAQERADILEALQVLERQLTEPVSKWVLQQTPIAKTPDTGLAGMVEFLKRELHALKAQLGEPVHADDLATPVGR